MTLYYLYFHSSCLDIPKDKYIDTTLHSWLYKMLHSYMVYWCKDLLNNSRGQCFVVWQQGQGIEGSVRYHWYEVSWHILGNLHLHPLCLCHWKRGKCKR